MRWIGQGVRRFYVKAYTDNLTGLAGMVAYSLLLSIFPVALIALFVAGQVLASPRLEHSVLADLQELFPSATSTTLSRVLREIRGSSTTVGIVAFVASLWVATSFWGALDTAFCRIYGVPCRSWVRQKLFGLGMLGLVLLFFATTVALPAVQYAGAVVNELRLLRHRSDTLAAMPDSTTEGMRIEQLQRERDEHARAKAAGDEPETEQHERRAQRAGYLEEKLKERGEAEDAAREG